MVTPLSHRRFRIANTHEQRVIISFEDEDGYQPLQREQFETLHERIHDDPGAFDLDRLPPDADPTVLSVHPRYEVDEDTGTMTQTETTTGPSLLDADPEPAPGNEERAVRIEAVAERLSDAGWAVHRGPETPTIEKGNERYRIHPSGKIDGDGQFYPPPLETLVGTYTQ